MSDVLQSFAGQPERTLAKGESLLEEGCQLGRLYALVEGSVEILKGDIQVNVVSRPGAILGEVSVLLNQPHMATVRALTPCRVFEVEHGVHFLRAHPELNLHLARLLARRLNSVTSYLADMKAQYQDREDHLGMVDEVLEGLLHHHPKDPGAA